MTRLSWPTRPPRLAVLGFFLVAGCGDFRHFAPRTAKARAPVSPERVELVPEGKPQCPYRVIGGVFARGPSAGLEALREVTANAGGDGVYDIECEGWVDTLYGGRQRSMGDCSGRAYVCVERTEVSDAR